MWICTRVGLAALGLGAAEPAMAQDYPSASPGSNLVWMTDALEKVQPGDTQGAARPLYLSGGGNSFIDFQVHARAGANPLRLSVTASDFVATNGASKIPASDVVIYREAYLDIPQTQLSDANGRAGLTPDPLIPAVDPYFHEARNAFPVTVTANTTQSVWVDVFAPAKTPAGTYTGTITVLNGATTMATLKPVIKVWGFTLPATATLASAFAIKWDGLCIAIYTNYKGCAAYPGANGNSDTAVDLMHVAEATLLLDHRLSIENTVYYGPPDGTWAHHDQAYGAALSGKLNTFLPGAALTSSEFYYPGSATSADIADWVAHYKANGWLPKLFDYTYDEPQNASDWQALIARAQTMHAGSPLMRTLVTTSIDLATANGALGDIDILTPVVNLMEPRGGANQRSKYDSWLKLPQKRLWWYQSCSEHQSCSNGVSGDKTSTWPSYMIDASPIRNRVFQWLAYLDQIGGELYYQIDKCWVPGLCAGTDPWKSLYIFGGNGDGTLIYPGKPALIGGTIPIALPSLRLKLIRDGMQDYEMLHALTAAGQGAQATKIARGFITSATVFTTDPATMAAARETLGDALAAKVGAAN